MVLEFKNCIQTDLKTLAQLSRNTFIDAFAKQNNSIDFEEYINKAFSLSNLEKELSTIDSQFFFMYIKKQLVGYFKLNENNAQNELKEKAGIELERIYIKKSFQGKKLGTQTIAQIIKIAYKKEKQYIWLGVWERNLDAIRFYQRHDFVKFDTHPYYIGNDRQIDWLMRKEL